MAKKKTTKNAVKKSRVPQAKIKNGVCVNCNSLMQPGWQLREEVPMLAIIFLVVGVAMWNAKIGNLSQIVGTSFLVSVVAVSLEVLLTGRHKR